MEEEKKYSRGMNGEKEKVSKMKMKEGKGRERKIKRKLRRMRDERTGRMHLERERKLRELRAEDKRRR